jgi:bifunctional non-homologous end joining protein LigD
VCFDLLHFAGLNLRGAPYLARHRYLTQCLLPCAHVQRVHNSADANELYQVAVSHGFEGVVAKRIDATYQPGKRSGAWLKIKAEQSGEFVVGGCTRGKGARESLGALLLGYYEGKALRYAGHVGSGLDDAAIERLTPLLKKLTRKDSPFEGEVELHRPTTWLQPELVAEVTYSEWTPTGALRAPVFLRLRDDIAPQTVVRRAGTRVSMAAAQEAAVSARPEAQDEVAAILAQLETKGERVDLDVAGARIRLTHLDRVYWPAAGKSPAVTKRDLLRYLTRVARFMLPHLEDRPLTMIRMPEGIEGERFFQKHWAQALPEFVETVTVFSETRDEQHRYLLANNLPTLLWLGQVGTLEFHVWHSRARVGPDTPDGKTDYSASLQALEASVLNYPDYLVFDLDPYIYSGKEAKGEEPELNKKGFAVGKRVAFWIRAVLKEMKLEAIIKTSGKTGLHMFVPIERTVTFDEARHICETVGRHVMRAHPKDITMDWAIEKRTGKIFIDHNMNVRGKTLNVAYSPRGVPGTPISMPLTWEELEAAEPQDFNLNNVPARLEKRGDRWHDVLELKQSLTKAFGVKGEK